MSLTFEPLGGLVEVGFAGSPNYQRELDDTRGMQGALALFTDATVALADYETNPPLLVLTGSGTGDGNDIDTTPEQYIRGRVVDIEGLGAARTVIAIDRATGRRLAVTTSDSTGNFVIRPRSLEPCILVAVPLDGEQLNAVALDNILPVPD